MAKAKKPNREIVLPQGSHVIIPDELPPDRFDEPPAPETFAEGALAGMLAEIGTRDDADAKVTVKKIDVTNGVKKELWLYECEPDAFSVSDLQEHYGAGDYRVQVFGKMPDSNYRGILANKRISIAGPKHGGTPKALAGAQSSALAPVGALTRDEITRAMNEALAGPFNALAQALAQMNKVPTRAEMLQELKQMREIFGNGPAQPQLDPLTMLERAVTLVKAAAPAPSLVNEDGEVPPGAIISQGIGLVREFFEAAQRGKMNNAQPVPNLPAPDEPQPRTDSMHAPMPAPVHPVQPPQNQQEGDDEMRLFMKAQMAMLLHAAKQNMDTGLYSGLIYEQAPDDILSKLQSDTWWDELVKLEPAFSSHKPWCEKLRNEVVAIITEENTPDAPAANNAGDDQPDEPAITH